MKKIYLIIACLLPTAVITNATVRYVSPAGSGSGSSWTNASGDIAAMITASASGDQIWIKKGTYTPAASLSMKNGVAIYGGFAGTETALNQRNFTTNMVVLDGNNIRRIFNNSNLINTAVLDGVTISNGVVTNFGGGMLNNSSNPTISNCIFQNNRSNNSAGGGMYNTSSSPTITNCVFTGNSTVNSTGGGAIYNAATSNPIINNCVFNNNTSGNPGGAIFNESSSTVTINNSVFTANSGSNGGAIYDGTSNSSKFINCVFTNNSGSLGGAFYFSSSSTSSIVFCTITNNSGIQGGGILTASTNIKITNSIVFNNTASSGGANIFFTSTPPTVTITNSDIQGGYTGPGAGNINVDPIFFSTANLTGNDGKWMTADDGLQLKPSSPCLNAGATGVGIPTTDILGVARSATAPTIGAYEVAISNKIFVNGGIAASGIGFTWATAKKTIQEALQIPYADTIWAAAGTYIPAATLNMRNGLAIIGGFSGIETQLSQRNIAANPVIISGNNARQVFNNANLNNTAVLDGCIIANGNSTTNGAGMYNSNAHPTIRNCVFKDNICNSTQNEGGGGMYNYYSNPAIINCVFANNTVNNGLYGGGMSNDNSNPAINNCIFIGNTANNYGVGAGMFNFFSNPVINNSVFTGNSAPDADGGGMYNWSSTPVITNTIIYGNSANTNSNIFNQSSSPVITYSDIEGGFSGTGNINSDPLFVNGSLPAGNDGKWMTADDGLQLQVLSPALNIGNNAAVPTGITTDITGSPRIQGGTVDLGCYEFQLSNFCTNTTKVYVDSTNGNDANNGSSWAAAFKSLAVALIYAQACNVTDSILVAKGTYYPTGLQSRTNRDQTFLFSRGKLKLIGGYPAGGGVRNINTNTTILSGNIGDSSTSGDNSYHVIAVAGLAANADSVVVDGLNITGGSAAGSSGTLLLNGVNVDRVTGGGIVTAGNNDNTKIAFRNCNLSFNSAQMGGGMYNNSTSPTVTNCSFSNNSSGFGGGMANSNLSTPLTITNCSFSNNSSNSAQGGGMLNTSSSPILNNCTFSNNSGCAMYNNSSSPTINNTSFSNNNGASNGAGMYNIWSSPTLSNCSFSGNTSSNGGGGMYNLSSSPILTNCSFNTNSSNLGGGLFNDASSLTLTSCSLQGNTATTNGGGVFNNNGGTPSFIKCTFSANTASKGGGAYNNSTSPVISNCNFGNNIATNGGAIYNNNGTINISSSLFSYNSANAIYNNLATVNVTNCNINHNTTSGDGGGILNIYTTLTINNSTISNNTASGNGGGIFIAPSSAAPVSINNSIIYGNSSGIYVNFGTAPTVSYSNIQGGFTGTGNINANPLFVDATNGNYHLACGSPSINTGTNASIPSGVNTDLDSATRIQAGTVDMGAYEASSNSADTSASLASTTTATTKAQSGTQIYAQDCSNLIATLASINPAPASGNITAKVYVDATAPAYNGQRYVRRHYDITPADTTVANTGTATITLYFTQADFDDYNANRGAMPALPAGSGDIAGIANFRISQQHGTSSTGVPGSFTGWNGIGPANVLITPALTWNAIRSRWEATFPVTGFSGFFASGNTSTPLPLTLLSFTGTLLDKTVQLNWQTANELGTGHFEVEKSTDGSQFTAFSSVTAIGSGNNKYYTVDRQLQTGNNFYRLKMVDKGGGFTYGQVIKIRMADAANATTMSIYPNPAKNELFVNCNGNAEAATISIYSIDGRMLQLKAITSAGLHSFDIAALAEGGYIIVYQTPSAKLTSYFSKINYKP